MRFLSSRRLCGRISALLAVSAAVFVTSASAAAEPGERFRADAAAFGFSPGASGLENARTLQRAVDQGGTITVTQPGTYPIAATVLVGSNTSLIFGSGVFLKKVAEKGVFTHVLLNKGALTRTYDEHIAIEGLQLIVVAWMR